MKLFTFLFYAVFLLSSCRPSTDAPTSVFPFSRASLESKSPEAVFELAGALTPPSLIDTLYQPLIQSFLQKEQMDKAAPHFTYYEKLRGSEPSTEVFRLNTKANLLQFSGHLDSSINLYTKSLHLAESNDDKSGQARAMHGIGSCYFYQGNYAESTQWLLKAMNAFENLGDSLGMNIIKLEQCGNLYRMKDCQQTISLAQSTLHWFQKTKDTFNLTAVYNTIGVANECVNNIDAALLQHQKALHLRYASNDIRGAGESLNNIAVLLVRKKQYGNATEYYKKSLEMLERAGDFRNLSIIRSNYGQCRQYMGQNEEAESIYMDADKELRQNGQLDAVVLNLERLSYVQKIMGKDRVALTTYLKTKQYRDSLFNERKKIAFQELNVRFETALKEQQIARLEAQKRSNQLLFGLLVLGFILSLTLLFSWVFRLQQKQKLLAQEQILLEAREKAHEKDLEIAQLELDFNRRQLEETTSQLTQKSRLLEEFHANLDHLGRNLGEHQPEIDIQQFLSPLYGMKILTDNDWNVFRQHFEQAHPGLINQYKKTFPGISDAELRLILLIKMGIKSREIANMLGISTDSVSKTRYRLRKRLGLDELDKLEGFIEHFN